MATPAFNPLTISNIRPLTGNAEDGVALTFDVPEPLKAQYQFIPGQYLTLRAQINGEDIRRSYSICSHHSEEPLEVGIKCVEGGQFSNFAKTLNAGDQLQVMTPEGRFTAAIGGKHSYLLIAAGSGITPCLSIAKSVLTDEPDSHIALLYGNHNTDSIMFREDVDNLKNRFTERFMLAHILTAEKQDAAISNGRIDTEKLNQLSEYGLIDAASYDAIYLCGPQAMTEQCTEALLSLGANKERIKFELFTTADSPVTQQQTKRSRSKEKTIGTPVTLVIDGAERTIQVDGDNETVLAAGLKAGLDLPFSCAGGMCCTCRCKVASGDTEMDLNFSLADWEVEAGYTLACQTRPKSNDVVLDFDAT